MKDKEASVNNDNNDNQSKVIEIIKTWAEKNGLTFVAVTDSWYFGKTKEISLINSKGELMHYRVRKDGAINQLGVYPANTAKQR